MRSFPAEQKWKHDEILCYLLFAAIALKYLLPPYLNGLIEQARLLDLLLTLFAMGLVVLFFLWKKCIPQPSVLMVVAVYLCLLVSTLKNRGDFLNALLHSVQVILLCMLIDAVVRVPSAQKPFLRAVRDVTLVFYVVNFFLMYILPNGIPSISAGKAFPCYLYGNYNSVIRYVLPGLCCSLMLDSMKAKRRTVPSVPTLIVAVGIVVSAVTVYFTATAVITVLALILWALCGKRVQKHAWKLYGLALFLLAVVELVFVVGAKGGGVLTFVANVFQKPIDFHGRVRLWARMMESLGQKPWFGFGLEPYDTLQTLLGNGYGAHNYALDLFRQRGAVGLAAVLVLLVVPVVRGWKQTVDRVLYIAIGACCAYTVLLLMEPCYDTEYLMIPLFYALFAAGTRAKGLSFDRPKGQGGQDASEAA